MFLFLNVIKDYLLERNALTNDNVTIIKHKRKETLNTQWPFFVNLCVIQMIVGSAQIAAILIQQENKRKCWKMVMIDVLIAVINIFFDKVIFRFIKPKMRFKLIVILNLMQAFYLIIVSQYVSSDDFKQQKENVTRLVYMLQLDMVLINIQPFVIGKLFTFTVQYVFLAYYYQISYQNFGYHIAILCSFTVYIIEQESKFRRLLNSSLLPKLIINSLNLPVFLIKCSDMSLVTHNTSFNQLISQLCEEDSAIFKQKAILFSQIKDLFNLFETQIEDKIITLADIILEFKSQNLQNNCLKYIKQRHEFRIPDNRIFDINFQAGFQFDNSKCAIVVISEITAIIEKAQLNERTQLKSQLIKSMSHELRTRKNIIQGLLKMHLDSNKQADELIEQAYSNSLIESTIISSIINYNLSLENQLLLNYQSVIIKEQVQKVVQYFKYDLQLRNIQIIYEIDQSLTFSTDVDLFAQIMLNLLSNSIKHSKNANNEQSFISIKCYKEQNIVKQQLLPHKSSQFISLLSLEVELPVQQSFIVIKMVDNGCGISKQQLLSIQQILENENLGTTRMDKSDGFYLGLRSCNQLIQQLNQSKQINLEIQSIQSQYTEVIIRFQIPNVNPIVSNQNHISQETQIQDVKLLNPFKSMQKQKIQEQATILIVDDEPFNQMILKDLLLQMGYKVKTANNGYDAFQIIQNQQKQEEDCPQFYAIFMDYQMPIMNGVIATRHIISFLKQSHRPIPPIIGCTAFSAQEDIKELLDAGMISVCVKPINKTIIRDVLQKVHNLRESATIDDRL